MSGNVKVLLPEGMESSQRAFFYQSLSTIDYFLLPGTQVELDIFTDEESDGVAIYEVKIQLKSTVIKAAIRSEDYFVAVRKIFNKVGEQLAVTLKKVSGEQSQIDKKVDAFLKEEEGKGKIIH